jgi:hypothetical protein
MDDNVKSYYKKVHFWGILTLSMGIIFSLSYGSYLSFVKGYHPGWDKIIIAFLGVAAMVGHTWVNVADQITYILLMGPAATYMSCLTGNIKNMRLPSALASKAAVGAEEGSIKEDIISTIGVGASVIVNTTFLIILVVAGSNIIKLLPVSIITSLNYIVPALFGAIFAQFALMNYKAAIIALAVGLVLISIAFIPSFLKTFITIILVILINVFLNKMQQSKQDKACKKV